MPDAVSHAAAVLPLPLCASFDADFTLYDVAAALCRCCLMLLRQFCARRYAAVSIDTLDYFDFRRFVATLAIAAIDITLPLPPITLLMPRVTPRRRSLTCHADYFLISLCVRCRRLLPFAFATISLIAAVFRASVR